MMTSMNPVRRAVMLAAPGVVLAGLGLTHPDQLTRATAEWWTNLHVMLVPLFPLFGVALWMLIAGEKGWLAWAIRIAAFGYVVFYGALDVLAGVGTGWLVLEGAAPNGAEVEALFNVAGSFAFWGTRLLVVACVLTAYLFYVKAGRATLPGGIVLVLAAVVFRNSHIYWPEGGLSCLGLAVGLGWLGATARLNLRNDIRQDLSDRLAEDPAR
jgi:hypothetical protein